jgi:hypothetical protein
VPIISTLGKLQQGNCELEACLDYINLVSKNNNNKNKNCESEV